MPMWLETAKTCVDLAKGTLECAAAIGGGWWFFRQSQAERRIQFDLSCSFVSSGDSRVFAEVQCEFENKGFVEHRIYDLTLSIHALAETTSKVETGHEAEFTRTVLSRRVIVPRKYGFYFVRPGVRQVITHLVLLPQPCPLVRITAGFNYTEDGKYPHTARRVFQVPTEADVRSHRP